MRNLLAASVGRKASTNRQPLPQDSLDLYLQHCLPGGEESLDLPLYWRRSRGPKFARAIRKPRAVWLGIDDADDPPCTLDYRLSDRVVRSHVAGSLTAAAPYPALVDCFEFDIDFGPEQVELFGQVEERFPRGIAWTTSFSRGGPGLRYRVPLVGMHDQHALRSRVLAELHRAGIPVKGITSSGGPGVEVWPHGDTASRLPLGAQSDIVTWAWQVPKPEGRDPYGFFDPWVPLTATVGCRAAQRRRGGSLVAPVVHRNPEDAIRLWAKLVAERRVHVDDVLAPADTYEVARPICPREKMREGEPCPRARPGRGLYWERVELALQGAQRGQRCHDGPLLVFHWRVRLGLDRDEVLRLYRHWLWNAEHTSRDLTGPKQAWFRETMLEDAVKQIRSLDAKVAAGTLRSPTGGELRVAPLTGPPPPPSLIFISRAYAEERGGTWRSGAIRMVSAADRAVAADVEVLSLRRWVLIFLGLLRWQERRGPFDRISLGRRALARITCERAVAYQGRKMQAYQALLAELVRLGVVGELLQQAKKKVRARVYRVALPREIHS